MKERSEETVCTENNRLAHHHDGKIWNLRLDRQLTIAGAAHPPKWPLTGQSANENLARQQRDSRLSLAFSWNRKRFRHGRTPAR